MLISTNTRYYAISYVNSIIYILNDDWQYISNKSIGYYPYHMTSIANNLYIVGINNLWKTDKDLNVLITYNMKNSIRSYWDLYLSPANNLIYVSAPYNSLIHVFDLNLNLIDTISTLTYQPRSISSLNSKLYVGCDTGIILVIENKQITSSIKICYGVNSNSDMVSTILFDQSGYMAAGCYISDQIYLYNNFSFTGKSIYLQNYLQNMGFDSKGRFIVISSSYILIYY